MIENGRTGSAGEGRRNDEIRRWNNEWGLEHRFQPAFEPMGGGWGSIHDGFSTFMSITFLPAEPRFPLAAGPAGLIRAGIA
jgi:hypothetical protein